MIFSIKVKHRIEGMTEQKLLKWIETCYMPIVNVFHGADNPLLISSCRKLDCLMVFSMVQTICKPKNYRKMVF